MLLGVLYLLKRKHLNIGGRADLFDVNVIFTKSVLPKKYISFVRVGDKIMVLGISEQSMTLLKEIEWSDNFDEAAHQSLKSKNFLELFKQNLRGK